MDWIAENSDSFSLKKLHPAYGKEIFTVIERVNNLSQHNQNYLDFTPFEVKVLKLVFNYCHYYLYGAKSRFKEFANFSKSDYLLCLENLMKTGQKIRVKNIKLSSLIFNDDRNMSELVQALEEDR